MTRRRLSPRTRARRNLRAAEKRAARQAERDEPTRPGPRLGQTYPEPPEGLTGDDLANWHAEQRTARRVARIEAAEAAFEAGTPYVEALT